MPAFAVKTRSGRPSTGSSFSIDAPAPTRAANRPSNWALARSQSGCTWRCMYGLISYDDVEVVGGADQEPPAPCENAHLMTRRPVGPTSDDPACRSSSSAGAGPQSRSASSPVKRPDVGDDAEGLVASPVTQAW